MASAVPENRPYDQPVQQNWDNAYGEHPVNELLSNKAGSQSPFGDDVSFPLPVESLFYQHPGPDNRPHLAGD
ncbi:MAG TPA: hypothetical protein VMB79_16820 [Jatrophihabitans sp.]|nr:hypothetical protein [Jatrophihabitans sp.]